MTRLIIAVCAAALLLPAGAAPSFDCAKASGPIESAICKSAALSAADRKLADTYNGALAKVSEPGRAILRDGQRQWLAYVHVLCWKPEQEQSVEDCLKDLYADRQERLDKSVTVAGGVTFVRAAIYKERKEKKEDANDISYKPFSTLDAAYPEIGAPKSKADAQFNAAMAGIAVDETKTFNDGGSDFTFDYDTVTVTGRLISVDTTTGFYGHGAAHPNSSQRMVHWLRAEGRLMKAEDLFAANTGWLKFLRAFCFAKVKDGGFVDKPEALNDMVKNPERWVFARKGLKVRFNPYEVASYAEGPQEVMVPWTALKPYLVKNPPVKF